MVGQLKIGSQAPDDTDTGSLLKSIQTVVKMGGNVVQVFLRNMCSSSPKDRKKISPAEIKKVREYIKKNKLNVFVHASYLLNFCKKEAGYGGIFWAYQLLREDMVMAEKMGMEGVVLHMCSTKKAPPKGKKKPLIRTVKETEKVMVAHIKFFLDKFGGEFPNVKLLLENSAAENGKIGGKMKEFGNVYRPLRKKYRERIGICLDTCHLFAAGYDIGKPTGVTKFLRDFKKDVGEFENISLIHLNDSRFPLGSKRDRHAGLGEGFAFRDTDGHRALCSIVVFSVENNIPMCLETHGDYPKEIAFIHALFNNHRPGQKGGTTRSVSVSDLADRLEELGNFHKSLGNKLESDQYNRAIGSLRTSGIKSIKKGIELTRLPYIGKGIASKADEFISTGKIALLEEFKKDPKTRAARELTKIFDVGPATAKTFIQKGITTIPGLKKAVRTGKVKLTRSQSVGLKYYDDLVERITRKQAENVKNLIKKEFKRLFSRGGKTCTILAGSYRTGKKTLGDVDLVLAISTMKTLDDVKKHPILKVLVTDLSEKGVMVDTLSGPTIPRENQVTYMGVMKPTPKSKGIHVDLHLVGWDGMPFHLLYFGSGETFSRAIRQRAKDLGMKLSDRGLYQLETGEKLPVKTEKEVFDRLDLVWIPPEKRRDTRLMVMG